MNNTARGGFMLLEAILAVVLASICLTFIAQSLLTNFRTGVRFQEMVRSFLVMENRLDLLYATNGSQDILNPYPQALEAPYDRFSVSAQTDKIDEHLRKVDLKLDWPAGSSQGHLNITTFLYGTDETPGGT